MGYIFIDIEKLNWVRHSRFEEEEELNIEKICQNMLSSDECLNQALENVKKEYAETIELMD